MSDTVKLIIEIDKRAYKACQELRTNNDDGIIGLCAVNAIAKGTPLDDIKAEIEKLNSVDYGSMFSYESHNGARDMKRDILDIIDSIGNSESQKLVGLLSQSLEDAIDCS